VKVAAGPSYSWKASSEEVELVGEESCCWMARESELYPSGGCYDLEEVPFCG